MIQNLCTSDMIGERTRVGMDTFCPPHFVLIFINHGSPRWLRPLGLGMVWKKIFILNALFWTVAAMKQEAFRANLNKTPLTPNAPVQNHR